MARPDADTLIEAASALAFEIARLCPDCAERARELGSLVSQLRSVPLDRGAVGDAIGSGTLDSDLSDAQVRTTTEAVIRAARDEGV